MQARSQDLEKGGAFLKEWEKYKRPWPEFSLFLNQNHTVCPKIEREFLGKLGNSNVFSAQKQVVSKKKKKRSWPKLRLIFRPKSEIQTLFQAESRHVLYNFGTQFLWGGAVFNFSPEIGLKSSKNVRFCILHKPMGARAPPRPSWLRYCLHGDIAFAPEPRIFLMPKTFEITNMPGTVPQFILRTQMHSILQYF